MHAPARSSLLALALELAACAAARRAPPAASPPLAPASPPSGALELVRSLSDEVGPRLAGSPGDALAVAWGVRTMTALGLTNVRAEPVRVPHWVRGAESGEIVAPVHQRVVLTALGGSVATPPDGLTADVVEVASLDALDHLPPAAIAGRIVFYNVPTERHRDGAGYGQAVSARVRGAARAGRLGAVGVVVRSIGTDTNRLPHTGAMRYDDGATSIPAAALSAPDADIVHRLLAAGTPVRLRMVLGCQTLPEADSANVVGEVAGTTRASEVVLLGAHLDSWDLGTGAIDDGAGCAIVLAAAHRLATAPTRPARTVRVVLFANEENGGAGAEGYARAHAAELPRHVVAIEADAGDGRVYGARYRGSPAGRAGFTTTLGPRLAPLAITLDDGEAHGGADLAPLAPAGVPVIDLRQDMSTYFDFHHSANDTPAIVQGAALDQAVEAFATTADAIAQMPGDFGRASPPSAHEH